MTYQEEHDEMNEEERAKKLSPVISPNWPTSPKSIPEERAIANSWIFNCIHRNQKDEDSYVKDKHPTSHTIQRQPFKAADINDHAGCKTS